MEYKEFFLGCGLIALIVLGTIGFFTTWDTVPAGHKGVRLTFGAVTGDVVDAGFYWKKPFVDKIVAVNVQTQKVEIDATAASSDTQAVSSVVSLNYRLDPSKVGEMYENVGLDYEEKIMKPSLGESIKAVTAGYSAVDLILKRGEVNASIYELLKTKFSPYGIIVEGLNITDFDFSEQFNKAIENKVTAEQDALAAKNKLEQIKFEAQQNVERSKGEAESTKQKAIAEAESIRIQAEALRSNPGVLQLRWIEKWNGTLPTTVTGDSSLLISPK